MRILFTAVLVIATCACHMAAGPVDHWQLVWADEFNGPDGTHVDTAMWSVVIGGDGWGNKEREYYADELANVRLSHGQLMISATESASAHACWYGPCKYMSARLQTKAHFEQVYGRFEARIKVPQGQGLWPAFWMLGNDIDAAGWPACGEIDVMENIGKEPDKVHGTLHGPGYAGADGITGLYKVPAGVKFADDFHVFSVEWEKDAVRFYVDDKLYETRTPADLPPGRKWAFDHPFFLLLNLAVGGTWPGDPDATTTFPQTMQVDYVRVYRRD
jgi:beta-glucanase (GH16 family)